MKYAQALFFYRIAYYEELLLKKYDYDSEKVFRYLNKLDEWYYHSYEVYQKACS